MILTQEQEMIRDALRDFSRERLAPFAEEWDRNHSFPREALKELAALGALGMVVPEQWGGAAVEGADERARGVQAGCAGRARQVRRGRAARRAC